VQYPVDKRCFAVVDMGNYCDISDILHVKKLNWLFEMVCKGTVKIDAWNKLVCFGQADRRTGGQADRRTSGQADKRTSGRVDEWTGENEK
jgi:hypothetical protein